MLDARKWIFVALNKKESEMLNISTICNGHERYVRENLRQTKTKYFQTEISFPVLKSLKWAKRFQIFNVISCHKLSINWLQKKKEAVRIVSRAVCYQIKKYIKLKLSPRGSCYLQEIGNSQEFH